jgi:hypothetical protein
MVGRGGAGNALIHQCTSQQHQLDSQPLPTSQPASTHTTTHCLVCSTTAEASEARNSSRP